MLLFLSEVLSLSINFLFSICNFRTSTAELKKMSFKATELSFVHCSCVMDLYIAIQLTGRVLFFNSFACSYILFCSTLGLKHFTFSVRKEKSQFAQLQYFHCHTGDANGFCVCVHRRNVDSQYFTCIDRIAVVSIL